MFERLEPGITGTKKIGKSNNNNNNVKLDNNENKTFDKLGIEENKENGQKYNK